MSYPVLPLVDLAESIVDYLAASTIYEDDHRDTGGNYSQDLKSCALASRVFTPHCQKHLFHMLDLWHYDKEVGEAFERFRRVADNNPRILSYVRILRICMREGQAEKSDDDSDVWCSIVENPENSQILEKLCHVEEFHLCGAGTMFGCPPIFRAYIYNILSLPSLKSVLLSSGNGSTWSPLYFVYMLHVQELYLELVHLDAILPEDLEDLLRSESHISKYSDRKPLRKLHIGGSANETTDILVMLHHSPNTSFVLSHVEELQIDPTMMDNLISCWNLMQLCESLRKFIWSGSNHLGEFFDIPINLGTLKKLDSMKYNMTTYQFDEDFNHLRIILSKTSCCSLESFEIMLSSISSSNSNYLLNSEHWGILEEYFTNRDLFPVLQCVKIKLVSFFHGEFNVDDKDFADFRISFPRLASMENLKLEIVLVVDD